MRQYGRQVTVQIGPQGGIGRTISGLQVAFRVVQTATSGPYTATIDVTNPAPATVAAARDPGNVVRLIAGHETVGVLFAGRPIPGGVRTVKRGPDRIMTIEAADGWRELGDAFISISYATPTTARQIVDEVIAQAGLPVGAIRVPDYTFERGVTLHGYARTILDELMEAVDGRWAVSDGALELHAADEPTVLGQRGPLISASDGNLIGSPTLRIDEQGIGNYEVRSLLQPQLRPWRAFRLQSSELSGDLVARDVIHQGDLSGQSWYTDVVARRL